MKLGCIRRGQRQKSQGSTVSDVDKVASHQQPSALTLRIAEDMTKVQRVLLTSVYSWTWGIPLQEDLWRKEHGLISADPGAALAPGTTVRLRLFCKLGMTGRR